MGFVPYPSDQRNQAALLVYWRYVSPDGNDSYSEKWDCANCEFMRELMLKASDTHLGMAETVLLQGMKSFTHTYLRHALTAMRFRSLT